MIQSPAVNNAGLSRVSLLLLSGNENSARLLILAGCRILNLDRTVLSGAGSPTIKPARDYTECNNP